MVESQMPIQILNPTPTKVNWGIAPAEIGADFIKPFKYYAPPWLTISSDHIYPSDLGKQGKYMGAEGAHPNITPPGGHFQRPNITPGGVFFEGVYIFVNAFTQAPDRAYIRWGDQGGHYAY